jgi:lipopolysaccharide transport system ATP-binding protein
MRDVIIVHNLSKCFNRYHTEKPVTIMEAALSGLRQMRPLKRFWALQNVSFTVAPGEMLGVIGQNGAGKSTLLQLIGGVGSPDEGKVQINGRIGALLDLGSGFHGDLTGRENAHVTSIVAGLTEREVASRFDRIVEFAELEGFIDNPVRTYSTGMQMRLAFSVAIHTEPDVLLVDEFLSVGDIAFQAKCLERIRYLKAQGCAIVFISHDAGQVQNLCDRVLWLRQGQVIAYGEPKVVIEQYVSEMRQETRERTSYSPPKIIKEGIELKIHENRFGSLEIEIIGIQLLPTTEIDSGDGITVEIEYCASKPIDAPIFSVSITQEDGQVCLDINTQNRELLMPVIQETGKMRLYLDRLDLKGGSYFVNVGIYEKNWAYAYDFHWHVYPLLVRSTFSQTGILSPPCRWEIKNPTISKLNFKS